MVPNREAHTMTLSLNLVPVYQWTHREFDGQDPWSQGQTVRWSVVVYRMVGESFLNAAPAAKQSVPSGSKQVPRPFVIGIFARAHNRYRVLPLALQNLWREGQVPDDDLPWLLHRVEQELWISDYPPARTSVALIVACLTCAALAYLCFSGAFQPLHLNQGLLLASFVFAGVSLLCLGLHFYLRQRRRQLERTWLRILQQRTSG
jgi:hypothetical protein